MLKIIDEVDIKELEKFGFKPKYSEDTGELNEYFYVNTKETGCYNFLGINIKKETIKKRARIRFIFKKDKYGVPMVKENKVWIIDNYKYTCTDYDILYDLIQAGLVEKIEGE